MATFTESDSQDPRIKKINEYEQAVPDIRNTFEPLIDLIASHYDAYYGGLHFIDAEKQWIKADTGLGLSYMNIEDSICYHTIQGEGPLYISDLTDDPRTKYLYYVQHNPLLRSYLGSPLVTPEGYKIGTVCVMDKRRDSFGKRNVEDIKRAASKVIEKFELHSKVHRAEKRNQTQSLRLKEIHHRLKNNLNLVTGLIDLERMQVSESSCSDAMRDIQKRIISISMLHRHLYESRTDWNVEIKKYLEELLEDICQGFVGDQLNLDYEVKGIQLQMPQHKAVYVGLLINELLTNSIKHAFQGRGKGSVRLNISYQDSICQIDYSDNGKGLPVDFELSSEESLGSTLINNFVAQLDGNINHIENEGTHFRITIPIDETE